MLRKRAFQIGQAVARNGIISVTDPTFHTVTVWDPPRLPRPLPPLAMHSMQAAE